MRLDRVYSEGEALVALKHLGFDVHEAKQRPGLYEATHPDAGGMRTFTVEQLCAFAEGAALVESLLRARAGVQP